MTGFQRSSPRRYGRAHVPGGAKHDWRHADYLVALYGVSAVVLAALGGASGACGGWPGEAGMEPCPAPVPPAASVMGRSVTGSASQAPAARASHRPDQNRLARVVSCSRAGRGSPAQSRPNVPNGHARRGSALVIWWSIASRIRPLVLRPCRPGGSRAAQPARSHSRPEFRRHVHAIADGGKVPRLAQVGRSASCAPVAVARLLENCDHLDTQRRDHVPVLSAAWSRRIGDRGSGDQGADQRHHACGQGCRRCQAGMDEPVRDYGAGHIGDQRTAPLMAGPGWCWPRCADLLMSP
jgi:hypothetical protein